MTKQAVVSMLEAASNNSSFKRTLSQQIDCADVVKVGAEKGYKFTEAELLSFILEAKSEDKR